MPLQEADSTLAEHETENYAESIFNAVMFFGQLKLKPISATGNAKLKYFFGSGKLAKLDANTVYSNILCGTII